MFEYVRIKDVTPGSILAQNVYDEKIRLLMKEGNVLSVKGISVIKELGYKGIYVKSNSDIATGDVNIPEPIIDDILQLRIIAVLQDIYKNKQFRNNSFDMQFHKNLKQLESYMDDVVDLIIQAHNCNTLLYEAEDNRSKGNWLFYHMVNVCILSLGIGASVGLSRTELHELGLGAVLHDIGKSWYSDEVVNSEKLGEAERKLLRDHTTEFFRILQRCQYPVNATYTIWQHHEKSDGSGYPNGLKDDKIVKTAKIVAVANAYDNRININPYNKNPMHQSEALEYMCASPEFDQESVRALLNIVAPYPVGTNIMLSNNKEALVIKNRIGFPLRPVVMIKGENGRRFVDMANDVNYRSVTVVGVK